MARREKIIWRIVGVALLFVIICVPVGLIPTHYEICETSQYSEKESCASHQVLPFLFLKVGKFLDASGVAVTAIFTVVLAFSTIALWKATIRLAEDAKTTAAAQAADTRILQRAYLSVAPAGITAYASGHALLACDIEVFNAGNLPARNVAWFIGRKFSADGEETLFPMEKVEGKIVIPPRVKLKKGGKSISFDDFDAQRPTGKGESWIYVYGRLEYSDGFQDGRFINFCHRYNMRATLGEHGREIQQWDARYHVHGNHTDEENGAHSAAS